MKDRVRCKTCVHMKEFDNPYRRHKGFTPYNLPWSYGATQACHSSIRGHGPLYHCFPLSDPMVTAWRKCDGYELDAAKVLLTMAEEGT